MEQELREFGLTEKEIQVYKACLHLGTALVQDIARKAGTYRTYTYEVLKSLKEKGLVSYVIKSGKQYFEVAEPEQLISILKEKQNRISSIMPDLKNIYKSAVEKPGINFYEGKAGLKTLLDDIIRTNKEIMIYCSARKQTRLVYHYFPNYLKSRIGKGIKARLLCEDSKLSRSYKAKDREQLREMRFLPCNKDLPTATHIYGNKVSIMTLEKDLIGVIIESEPIARTQRMIFEMLWGIARRQ